MTRKMFPQLLFVFVIMFLASIPANAQQCCENECAQDYAECQSYAYSNRIFCEIDLGCSSLDYPYRWYCEDYCYNEYLDDLAICYYYIYQPCLNNCPCYPDDICNEACGETHANCPNDCPCDNDGVCESGETDDNCPNDCYCDDDFVCEPGHGEDGGHGFTCYDCICDNDDQCESGQGEQFTYCPNDCYCDNDGVCEGSHGEDNAHCPNDCPISCQVCVDNYNVCMQYYQACQLTCLYNPNCGMDCQDLYTTCQNYYQDCMAGCE